MKKASHIIWIIFIFGILTLAWQQMGRDIVNSEHDALDDDSIIYIGEYSGFRESFNPEDLADQAGIVVEQNNDSGEKTVDFAQEYLDARRDSTKSTNYWSTINEMPDFFITALGFDQETWKEYKTITLTAFGLVLFLAFWLFIRGQV